MGLRAKAGRKFKVAADSAHSLPIAPNLLGQDFSCDVSAESTSRAKALDQVWLSDITYLWTSEGWLYVCGARSVHPPDRRLGDGWAHDASAGTRCLADGAGGARLANYARDAAIDEWHRQLLRQCAYGEFVAFDESRRDAWSGLCRARRGDPQLCLATSRAVQHDTGAFKFGVSIASAF